MSLTTKAAPNLVLTPYALGDRLLDVPCEVVDEHIAITPAILSGVIDGTCVFNGRFGLTHRATGLRFTGNSGACIVCIRRAAQRLTDMGIDWSTVTKQNAMAFRASLPADIQQQLMDVLYVGQSCEAMNCDTFDFDQEV